MDTSGFGYRPRLRLLDEELRLDPEIQRRIQELEEQFVDRRLLRLWLRPDFSAPQPTWQTMMALPPQRPAGPAFTPGAGPATPRPVLKRYLETTIGIVTALHPVLGYEKTKELAKEALESGKGVLELIREK